MSEATKRFGWAVIGTGAIARRFAADMRHSRTCEIVAVGARTPAKARALAEAIGPAVRGLSIADALGCDADAVYVATGNESHADLALAALAAGKPVLVEKPLASSAAEAERIAQGARDAGLLAMEALWSRFTPGIGRMRSLVAAGAIGELRRVEASVSFHPARPPAIGSLLDLGVYPVSLALHFAGPAEAAAALLRRDAAGRDVGAAISLRHASALSSLACGFEAEGANALTLVGTHGILTGHRSLLCPRFLTLRRTGRGADGAQDPGAPLPRKGSRAVAVLGALRALAGRLRERPVPIVVEGSGLHYQADHFADCVRAGRRDSPVMPIAQSLAALRLLEAAR